MQIEGEKLLLFLASKAGPLGRAKTSTSAIAGHFGGSQQTASRKLRQLKSQGLIGLEASPAGCYVSITREGLSLLRENFLALQAVFGQGPGQKPSVSGTVKSGLGEGRYYVSRPHYLKQFTRLFGKRPFLGTLNLMIPEAELASFASGLAPVKISGFETRERSFGEITAFRVMVQGRQKAILAIPERTTHPKNEAEVIAVVNLRKKLGLKDGSKVVLSLP